MTADRTMKVLLLVIAAALWLHLVVDVTRPIAVQAQVDDTVRKALGDPQLADIVTSLRNIQADTNSLRVSVQSLASSDAIRRRE